MKKEKTEKLYLEAVKPRTLRATDSTVWIPGDLYQQIDVLAQRTGRSVRELVGVLIRYALDNTIVTTQEELEE